MNEPAGKRSPTEGSSTSLEEQASTASTVTDPGAGEGAVQEDEVLEPDVSKPM